MFRIPLASCRPVSRLALPALLGLLTAGTPAALLLAAGPASALPPEHDPAPHRVEERAARPPHTGEKIYDAVVLRPFGFAQVVFSVPVLALAYPVTLLTGGSDEVVRLCWTDPTDRTFRRPLGRM